MAGVGPSPDLNAGVGPTRFPFVLVLGPDSIQLRLALLLCPESCPFKLQSSFEFCEALGNWVLLPYPSIRDWEIGSPKETPSKSSGGPFSRFRSWRGIRLPASGPLVTFDTLQVAPWSLRMK